MKMRSFVFIPAVLLFISCNNKKPSQPAAPGPSSFVTCYQYITAKDTVQLKLIDVDKAITGTLVYKLFEKDRNKGTILGYIKDGLLVADYTFMSEGMQSVRQVVFKQDNDSFMEGYGEIEIKNDRASFKDISSLKFDGPIKLLKVPCEK
ncbi:MAG TPA: hypothetical protein VF476_18135 [Chitinophagaceae bacterium]